MQISCADGTFDPRCDSHICTSWTIGMWNRFDMKITRCQTTVANCTQTHTFGCHLQIVILDTGDWQAFIYNLLILFKVLSSHLQSSLLFHFFSYSVRLNFCYRFFCQEIRLVVLLCAINANELRNYTVQWLNDVYMTYLHCTIRL